MTPRRTSRWGDGFHGERLPEYRVVVTERTRHGLAKRHTFILAASTEDDPGGPHWWECEPDRVWGGRGFPAVSLERRPLPTTVHVADGVDLTASALTVILEALVSQACHHIDLADIKVIVSQLGSRLAALDTFTAQQRRLAEPALYSEILRRCTIIDPSVTTDLEPGEKG